MLEFFDLRALEGYRRIPVQQAVNFRVGPCRFPDRISVDHRHQDVVGKHREPFLVLRVFRYFIYGSGFIEGKQKQIDRQVLRPLDDRHPRKGYGVAFRVKLRIHFIDARDLVDVHGDPRKGRIAYDFIAGFEAFAVVVARADLVDDAAE